MNLLISLPINKDALGVTSEFNSEITRLGERAVVLPPSSVVKALARDGIDTGSGRKTLNLSQGKAACEGPIKRERSRWCWPRPRVARGR